MITPRKGSIIERVTHHKTKREGAVRLHKPSMTFFARAVDDDVNTPTFESKDGREVREWLLKQLALTTNENNIDWVPAIEITQDGESATRYRDDTQVFGESLGIKIDRFYVGLTKDQREWRKLPWEACAPRSSTAIPDNERYAASAKLGDGPKAPVGTLGFRAKPFRLPHFNDGYNGRESTIAYTDELWNGLLKIIKQLKAQRALLKELIGTTDGISTVAEIGAGTTTLQLTAGASK